MCILELSKVQMFEFHYDYIKNKYGEKLRLLFTDNESLVYEIETENIYDGFNNNKEMFDFSNYSTKSKYYDNSNALVVGKRKYEMGGVAIEEFVELKPKIYLILVSNSSESKNEKVVNKNVVAKRRHNENKDDLLNKRFNNRVQSKNDGIGTYEINKNSLPCFGDKVYILDSGIYMLALLALGA